MVNPTIVADAMSRAVLYACPILSSVVVESKTRMVLDLRVA